MKLIALVVISLTALINFANCGSLNDVEPDDFHDLSGKCEKAQFVINQLRVITLNCKENDNRETWVTN